MATISTAQINPGDNTQVTITLATPVVQGDTVTVSYSGTTLRDDAGNQVAAITDQAVTNNTISGFPLALTPVVTTTLTGNDGVQVSIFNMENTFPSTGAVDWTTYNNPNGPGESGGDGTHELLNNVAVSRSATTAGYNTRVMYDDYHLHYAGGQGQYIKRPIVAIPSGTDTTEQAFTGLGVHIREDASKDNLVMAHVYLAAAGQMAAPDWFWVLDNVDQTTTPTSHVTFPYAIADGDELTLLSRNVSGTDTAELYLNNTLISSIPIPGQIGRTPWGAPGFQDGSSNPNKDVFTYATLEMGIVDA